MSTEATPAAPDVPAGWDCGLLGIRTHRPQRTRLRWLITGDHPDPQAAHRGPYEWPDAGDEEQIGICCSGGGIRSAAFNLGALQKLQQPGDGRDGILQKAKYVAAVSGGSYIAAAFAMVARTQDKPGDDDSDPGLVNEASPPYEPGSPEEQYLRNHLGYLAPDGVARLHLALRMLAGLLVNVTLVGLPLFIAGLLVGWFAHDSYGGMNHRLSACPPGGCDFTAVIPHAVSISVLAVTGAAVALALVGVIWRPRRDVRRQMLETWEVRLLLLAAAGAIALILVPWLAEKALDVTHRSNPSGHAGVRPAAVSLSSVVALFASAFAHVRGRIRDERRAIAAAQKGLAKYAPRIRELIISVVVMLAGPALLLATMTWGAVLAVLVDPGDRAFAFWLGGAAALLAFMWFITDMTSVSLHPFYRRRLCTAFALRRVWVDAAGEVQPVPADPQERARGEVVARQRVYDKLMPMSLSGVEPGPGRFKSWPMLVVCAAANISDSGATPPGRAVASFTFSPTAIGGPLTGAAKTATYEGVLARNRRRDVTLPAAVAMSGAALSPSMGKMTYRPMTFLLALANIRLGVWVLNPAHVRAGQLSQEEVHRREATLRGRLTRAEAQRSTLSPHAINPLSTKPRRERTSYAHRPRAGYLWRELFGRNRVSGKYLYITDGGHYENLGLVELLRRGCRTIYCFDAGGGATSGALADAIALAHSELNVTIDMEPDAGDLAENMESHRARRAVVRGLVTYPPAEPGARPVTGTLFYVRSVVTDDAPWEICAYQDADRLFPHHSTLDQFFDDRKFEAYRALGHHAADVALDLPPLHGVTAPAPAPPPAPTPTPTPPEAPKVMTAPHLLNGRFARLRVELHDAWVHFNERP